MAVEDAGELMVFLEPFPIAVRETALYLREFVWRLFPECNELIYDNYNALAFGWGLSERLGDVFCSIACYSSVNFGFNRGAELNDPQRLLKGEGKIFRYIKVENIADFPEQYMLSRLYEAHGLALSRFRPGKVAYKAATIVKSSSPVKRRPGSR